VVVEVITEKIVNEKLEEIPENKLEESRENDQKYSISKGDVFKPMKETVC
jgi:hypothetical protein